MATTKNKKLEKKMKIIETGYSLFKQNSVSATAIDDVVKAAGIARGTFYLYFKDKSDLLEQIIMYKSMECMSALLHELFNEENIEEMDMEDMARHILECFIDFLSEHKDSLVVITKNMSSFMRLFPDFPDPEIEEYNKRILDAMERNGYTRENASKIIYIATDMVGSVCSDAIMLNQPFPLETIRPTIIEAALAVIRSGR